MMRAIVLLIIAGIAGIMGYVALVGECPDGSVVRTEEQCVGAGGYSADICRTIFSRAVQVARASGTVYTDRNQCFREFGICLDHATVVGGYVPQPAGFCVGLKDGALASMVPVYRNAAAR